MRRRKKRLVAIILSFILLIFVSVLGYMILNPLRLETTEIICEYKKKFNPKKNVKSVFLGDKKDVKFKGKVDTGKLGKYKGQYSYKNKNIDVVIEVKDLVAPVLELKDHTTDTFEEITPELFVKKVEDDTKVKLSFESEPSKREGEHDVWIVAIDQSENVTKAKAKLKRIKDRKPPTLEINGELSFLLGSEYDLKEGIAINDDLDPAPVVDVDSSKIDFNNPGTYSISYIVKDRSGNETKVDRDVVIRPNDELHANVVYLTFDDGPSHNTERIIKILDKYDAKATFFVTGNHPEFNDNIKKAYDAGHTIGLHTNTHNYAGVYSSVDAYFEDLEAINDMVEKVTGERSSVIRFPGGSSNTISANYSPGIMSKLVEKVQENGYQYFDWNCDSTDASGNNVPVSQIVANATSGAGQYINILFHDTDAKDTTVEALPEIIEYYKSKGYIFLGLHSDSFAPHHGVNN